MMRKFEGVSKVLYTHLGPALPQPPRVIKFFLILQSPTSNLHDFTLKNCIIKPHKDTIEPHDEFSSVTAITISFSGHFPPQP